VAIRLVKAKLEDAAAIHALRIATANALTERFGRGGWSGIGTERGVRSQLRTAPPFIVRRGGRVIAMLTLSTRKPWAIDTSHFTACERPLYLTGMAVHPDLQRTGLGRQCLDRALAIAARWPAEAIRLDAFDAAAGAAEFYVKCGFREVARAKYRKTPLVYFERMV
jgi:ribosomal protein S18 acetylase RimI-like enzyme